MLWVTCNRLMSLIRLPIIHNEQPITGLLTDTLANHRASNYFTKLKRSDVCQWPVKKIVSVSITTTQRHANNLPITTQAGWLLANKRPPFNARVVQEPMGETNFADVSRDLVMSW